MSEHILNTFRHCLLYLIFPNKCFCFVLCQITCLENICVWNLCVNEVIWSGHTYGEHNSKEESIPQAWLTLATSARAQRCALEKMASSRCGRSRPDFLWWCAGVFCLRFWRWTTWMRLSTSVAYQHLSSTQFAFVQINCLHLQNVPTIEVVSSLKMEIKVHVW